MALRCVASMSAGAVCAAAYSRRPRPSFDPAASIWRSDVDGVDDGFAYAVSRKIAIGLTTWAMHGLIRGLNTTEYQNMDIFYASHPVFKDEPEFRSHNSKSSQETSKEQSKNPPLLTVSNHTSALDDPGLIGSLVPLKYAFRPEVARWNICSEEICFKKKIYQSFFGSGKTLPIQRGGGITQYAFKRFADKLRPGNWVHIFPEGRIWQTADGFDGRIGGNHRYMRWGVAKMICTAAVTPIVLPFYHAGMEEIIPQNEKRKVISKIPQIGKKVSVTMGNPIYVEDLVKEYKKYHEEQVQREEEFIKKYQKNAGDWSREPTEKEKRIFSDITKRIEVALKNLEKEVKQSR